MRRRLVIGLLTFGVLAGYGSGFAHLMRHGEHAGWDCHHAASSDAPR
jgi:hypothetical protein